MRNKCVTNHVLLRNETYYFLKRVPYDLKDYYSVKRLCFSLKTQSYNSALRMMNSVLQRLEDYWLGIRLQQMDIPAIKGSTVKQFLSAHNVPTKWSNRKDKIDTKDIYKIASKQTVMVVCHR